MDLALTPEQEMLKTAVRRFVQQEYPKDTLLQMAATGQSCPSEPWSKLAATGWLGIAIPQEYGGEGGSLTDAGVLFEELSQFCFHFFFSVTGVDTSRVVAIAGADDSP